MRRLCLLPALTLLLASCSSGNGGSTGAAPPDQARLVVAIVYDQFPNWAYERYDELLSPDGALGRTRARGARHMVEYSFAGTHTAVGHTAIFTGTPPARSGVGANQVWTTGRGIRSVVDDGVHPVFGVPDGFASPDIVKVESVADALRAAHGDSARIVALAFKDRGAVLAAGRDPDLALWYEKKIGTITGSRYYTDTLPAWVTAWNAENPSSRYYEDWTPGDPGRLQELLGPDDAPGEADYLGLGTTFPHNPIVTEDPNRTFRATPGSTDQLLDLARASVDRLGLGDDEVPDLLVLSISSIDYSGHVFGPESWEYVDNLIRVDTAIGGFLAELEQKTSVAVLITSDHGGARLPERSQAELPNAGRIRADTLFEQMNAAVARQLGKGEWVGPYVAPFVYLTDAARNPDKRNGVVEALTDALQALPEVHAAYDAREAAGWSGDPDPIRRAVALSIPDPEMGAVFLVLGRGSVEDEGFERGKGGGHGSPWPYDRQVPVLFAGPGVRATSSTEPLAQNRVAASLCALLGVAPPSQISEVRPLPGL